MIIKLNWTLVKLKIKTRQVNNIELAWLYVILIGTCKIEIQDKVRTKNQNEKLELFNKLLV